MLTVSKYSIIGVFRFVIILLYVWNAEICSEFAESRACNFERATYVHMT